MAAAGAGQDWGVNPDERHREALARIDLVLIHLAAPERPFIGSAEFARTVQEWRARGNPAGAAGALQRYGSRVGSDGRARLQVPQKVRYGPKSSGAGPAYRSRPGRSS
jgi:hypothetical protein